eukprot:522428-Prymnesium_polylepis.1
MAHRDPRRPQARAARRASAAAAVAPHRLHHRRPRRVRHDSLPPATSPPQCCQSHATPPIEPR